MVFPRSFGQICSEFSVTLLCIFQSKNSTYVKATQHQSVLNFDSTEFLFPNSKAFGILWKSVQTIVICQHSLTNTAVSWHSDARIPLGALLCRLPKSFVFNRCHHRNLFVHQRPSKLVNVEWLTLALHTTDVSFQEIVWSNICECD